MAVVVLLAGMTAFYTTRLAAERDRAQREAARAAKVSEVLTGLLMSADPISNRATPGGLTVRGLLDGGVEQAQQQLAGQPEAQAEILTVLGRIYRQSGVFDKAQLLLEQALASGEQAYGAEHVRLAQTLNWLGAVLAEKGDYENGARSLERALEMRRHLLGSERSGCGHHAGGARTGVSGPRTQPGIGAAAARGAGDPAAACSATRIGRPPSA